jgi:hypothetical protein
MSIPLFFAAVEWKGDFLVDGGVLNNYPIWVFEITTRSGSLTESTRAIQRAVIPILIPIPLDSSS